MIWHDFRAPAQWWIVTGDECPVNGPRLLVIHPYDYYCGGEARILAEAFPALKLGDLVFRRNAPLDSGTR